MTDKEKKVILQINSMLDSCSTVAIHGVSKKYDNSIVDIANKILTNGLLVNRCSGYNIAKTCKIIGHANYYNHEDIVNYRYSYDNDGRYINIVLAIPSIMTDSEDNDYVVGSFDKETDKYDEDASMLPINRYIMNLGYVPPEFIVGYITGHIVESEEFCDDEFILNPNYIGDKDFSDRAVFFDNIKDELILYGAERLSLKSLKKFNKKTSYR